MLRSKLKFQYIGSICSIAALCGFLLAIALMFHKDFQRSFVDPDFWITALLGSIGFGIALLAFTIAALILRKKALMYSRIEKSLKNDDEDVVESVKAAPDYILVEIYEDCRLKANPKGFDLLFKELIDRDLACKDTIEEKKSLIIDTGGPIYSTFAHRPYTEALSRLPVFTRYLSYKFIFRENTTWHPPTLYRHSDIKTFRLMKKKVNFIDMDIVEITYSSFGRENTLIIKPNYLPKWIEVLGSPTN